MAEEARAHDVGREADDVEGQARLVEVIARLVVVARDVGDAERRADDAQAEARDGKPDVALLALGQALRGLVLGIYIFLYGWRDCQIWFAFI